MPRMRTTLMLGATALLASACATSSGPFAATPAATVSPAPAVKADIEPQVSAWKTVVYANRRPTADMVFYGLADWRDATEAAKAAGAKEISLIFVFDGPTLPVTLGDAAYDRVMGTKAGNPWKSLVADLQKAGGAVEACGTRMKELGVGNADLLPGVKVDADGWTRVVDLHGKGYTVFQN
jgi:intracellular sulfur oxidation DsrE/DsrF family protein